MNAGLRLLLTCRLPVRSNDRTSAHALRLILIYLWAHELEGVAYRQMAADLGMGERTIYRAVALLAQRGMIAKIECCGHGRYGPRQMYRLARHALVSSPPSPAPEAARVGSIGG